MAELFEFRISQMSIEIFPARVDEIFNSSTGPIGSATKDRADEVLEKAKPKIGTRYSGHHDGPAMASTGSVVPLGGTAFAVVFSHPAAYVHHEGASAHPIGEPGKRLSNPNIPARTGGGPFYANGEVMWTPTASNANPFLVNAAAEVDGLRAAGGLRRGPERIAPIFRASSGQSF